MTATAPMQPKAQTGHTHNDACGQTAVLLATFNGARYLPDLLESLAEQTCRRFTVFVRDDGSEDQTPAQVAGFLSTSGIALRMVTSGTTPAGPATSFGHLLKAALTAPEGFRYFAFCDQDDSWHRDKLTVQLQRMQQTEAQGGGMPILVHSDLEVVDAHLRPIADSYWQQQRIDPAEPDLRKLLLRNVTVGCAMVINRPLAEVALPLPDAAIMHDWWITLIARAIGTISPINQVHVKYRQHGANTLGAVDPGWRRLFSVTHWRTRVLNNETFSALKPYAQAAALAERVPDALAVEWRARLALIADLPHQPPLQRRVSVLRSGIVPHDPVRLLGCLLKL